MMGGRTAHEFMFLSDAGEDSLVICDSCGYQANMEVAVSGIAKTGREEKAIQEVYTPDVKTIEELSSYLGITPAETIKAAVFARGDDNSPVVVFLRGDRTVNESKLRKLAGADLQPHTGGGTGFVFGYIGPYGLDTGSARVFYDRSLMEENNLVCGANKENYHLKNVSVSRDLNITDFCDISKACDGDACTICGAPLAIRRGIEVGNIFQLGNKYTKSMNMTYTDENGALQHPVMGCYGIGIGRLLACILENSHDDYGPVWPKAVAPWQVHICMLNSAKPHIREAGFSLYGELCKIYEVVLDDRDVPAGVQFADADLLGIPLRIIVSPRNLDGGMVELVSRDKTVRETVGIDDTAEAVARLLEKIK